MSGESTGVNIDTVDDYKRRIPDIFQSYSPDNIFNYDGTERRRNLLVLKT